MNKKGVGCKVRSNPVDVRENWFEHRPSPADHESTPTTHDERGTDMLLATTQVEDLDRFMDIFSTQGAERSASSTDRKARRSSAIPPRRIGCG